MAIVPFLLNLARDMEADRRSFDDLESTWDDDFGFGLHPTEIFRPRYGRSMLLHPRRRYTPYERIHALARRSPSGMVKETMDPSALVPTVGKDGFQVSMGVAQFKPNELTVKTVDRTVIVEGKHQEREDDHGVIQRHFIRKYELPKGFDPKDVVSTLSSDGVLTIKAAAPPGKTTKANERMIEIQQTGPAHLSVKAPEGGSAAVEGKAANGTKSGANEEGAK